MSFLCHCLIRHTHNRRVTQGNKPGMWVLVQDVSVITYKVIKYIQYLGDDGEVGEVGEYFGEAGVISAGAGGWINQQGVCHNKVIGNTHMLTVERNEERKLIKSVRSKVACIKNVLGESGNTHVRHV